MNLDSSKFLYSSYKSSFLRLSLIILFNIIIILLFLFLNSEIINEIDINKFLYNKLKILFNNILSFLLQKIDHKAKNGIIILF